MWFLRCGWLRCPTVLQKPLSFHSNFGEGIDNKKELIDLERQGRAFSDRAEKLRIREEEGNESGMDMPVGEHWVVRDAKVPRQSQGATVDEEGRKIPGAVEAGVQALIEQGISVKEIEEEAKALLAEYRPPDPSKAAQLRLYRLAWKQLRSEQDLKDPEINPVDPLGGSLLDVPIDIFGDPQEIDHDADYGTSDMFADPGADVKSYLPKRSRDEQERAGATDFSESEDMAQANVPGSTPGSKSKQAKQRAALDFSKGPPKPEPAEPEPPAPKRENKQITLPETHELTETERWLVDAALTGTGFLPGSVGDAARTIQWARQTAQALGATVAIGPSGSATAVAGYSLGAGLYFGPNGEIGAYGGGGVRAGVTLGVSVTWQVTIVKGGPSSLEGTAYATNVGGGDGLVGGVSRLTTPDDEFLGYSGTFGWGAGPSPVDIYKEEQKTWVRDPDLVVPVSP